MPRMMRNPATGCQCCSERHPNRVDDKRAARAEIAEEVLDVFFDFMEVRHWSTSNDDVDFAREATLRVLNSGR